MAKDTTPLEEFRRVTATTMRAISKKDVNVSFVPDGGSLLGQEARITVPARDLPVEDVIGEAPADDLDLRQLRHQEPAALEVAASFVSACQASSAAFCSASFLVRPTPEPRSRPATTAVAVNSFR